MIPPVQFVDAFERDAYSDPTDPLTAPGKRRRWRRRWHQLAGSAARRLAALTAPSGGNDGGGCVGHARSVPEPMSEAYEPRWLVEGEGDEAKKKAPPPLELAGGVPRVAWRWDDDDGNPNRWTKRRFFEALPFDLRKALEPASGDNQSPHPCPHCSFVLRYKTFQGRLFVESKQRRRSDLGAGGTENAAAFEEALLAGMHLYDVPDADFAVHLGDGPPPEDSGFLLLQQGIDRGAKRAGVAAPFFAWRDALGPKKQMPALAACLDARFPRDFGANEGAAKAAMESGNGGVRFDPAASPLAVAAQAEAAAEAEGKKMTTTAWFGLRHRRRSTSGRIPRAFWRGSSTDPNIATVDEANLLDVGRSRLALAGRWWPGLFDAAFTAHPQQAFSIVSTEHGGGNAAEIVLPLGKPVAPADQSNAWAVVVDADGNGWSDRFRHLALFSTPVLKQASNRTAFFEHVVAAPFVAEGFNATTGLVDAFAPDAFDLPVKARALLAALGTEEGSKTVRRRVARRRAVASALLSQPAVAEAAASAVALVERLSGWEVEAPVLVGSGGGGGAEGAEAAAAARSGGSIVLYEEVPRSRCCNLAAVPREFAEAVRRGRS
jgi:hypothetical protein